MCFQALLELCLLQLSRTVEVLQQEPVVELVSIAVTTLQAHLAVDVWSHILARVVQVRAGFSTRNLL